CTPSWRATSLSPRKRPAAASPRPPANQDTPGSPPDAACGLIRATRLRGRIPVTPLLEGEGHHVARISEAHPGSHARGPSSTPRDAPRMRPAALSGLRDYRGTILASPLPEGEDIT